jgi:RNA polymerase sigma factor (sigma-70 family)
MAERLMNSIVRRLKAEIGPADLTALSDRELLRRFLDFHDEGAFTALVRRHERLVYAACRQVLTEPADRDDAFQATFLVLVRRARSVPWRSGLGPWLYGVAHRVAVQARATGLKRQRREGEAAGRGVTEVAPAEFSWREAADALHAELARLPEKFRLPLLLCYLEGKSRDEVAEQLRLSVGTVKGRLERGRDLLRNRLARRGVTLTAGLMAAVADSPAAGALPSRLAESALRAAMGQASAPVAALAQGVTASMILTKLKLVAGLVLLLAAGILTVSALAPLQAEPTEGKTPPAVPRESASKPEPKEEGKQPGPAGGDKETYTYRGRVVDADGKAVAGAQVYLGYQKPRSGEPAALATTDAEGRYEFTLKRSEFQPAGVPAPGQPWWWGHQIAVALGHGIGWEVDIPATIKLPRNGTPVVGRVIDLEGKPVAGVRVRVRGLLAPMNAKDLTAWWKELTAKKMSANDIQFRHLRGLWAGDDSDLAGVLPAVTTGADGRFRLVLGEERLGQLRIEGPDVETADIYAATRPFETLRVPGQEPGGELVIYHGCTFDHVAAPCQMIEGVVHDQDTGKPIPGAVVTSYKRGTGQVSGRTDLRTVADARGRYRLTGMPRASGNQVQAAAPEELPYMMQIRNVPDPDGVKAARVDFTLKRGVWVTGRVLDKATGKPVHAIVKYLFYPDSPAERDLPGVSTEMYPYNRPDGSFRLVGLPGPGVVAARAYPQDEYMHAVGLEKLRNKHPDGQLMAPPFYATPVEYHTLAAIDAKPGAESVSCDLLLDAGRSLKGVVLDPDGKPLNGARVGRVKTWPSEDWESEPLQGAEFTALQLDPAKPRVLLFLHRERKLAGSVLIRGDEKEPVRVKLEPWGVLTGRILDEDDRPWSGATLRFLRFREPPRAEGPAGDQGTLPDQWFTADKDGRFRIEGLAPGVEYTLYGGKPNHFNGAPFNDIGPVCERVRLKAGETKDLADVRLKPQE